MDALAEELRGVDARRPGGKARADELFNEFKSLVDQVSASSPDEELKQARSRAENALAGVWGRAPDAVKELVIDAEFLRPILLRGRRDWFPVIVAWARCVEIILRSAAPKLDKSKERTSLGGSWSTASLGDFARLLKRRGARLERPLPALKEHAKALDELK